MNQLVVLDGLHHEPGEVHPPGAVAGQDRVAHVSAPHRQTLGFTFLEVAASYHGPLCSTFEDPTARLDLVVEVDETDEAGQASHHADQCLDLPGVDVSAVTGDVLAAREHQAGPGTSMVEHRLRGSRGVVVDPPRHQHGEDGIAAGDRPLDHSAIIRCTRNDGDTAREAFQLDCAGLPTHGDHLIAP